MKLREKRGTKGKKYEASAGTFPTPNLMRTPRGAVVNSMMNTNRDDDDSEETDEGDGDGALRAIFEATGNREAWEILELLNGGNGLLGDGKGDGNYDLSEAQMQEMQEQMLEISQLLQSPKSRTPRRPTIIVGRRGVLGGQLEGQIIYQKRVWS